ncbi:MAG: IclR family transcriptional regulator [Pseudomonadota bacterium]|nr:IclR family transcriptional regulator [Pseudomonadota bacterium]
MADTPRRGTQSIQRTFDILDVIAAQSPHGVTLKDICAIAGLSPATAHRMLGILLDRGIVERLSGGKRYVVGRELTLLGLSSELRRFREIASPSLSWLSETVGDAIFLSVRSGHDTVCADRRIGQFPIQVLSIEIGSRRPLGISANGAAMLSRESGRTVAAILDHNRERLDPFGTSRGTLDARIIEARRRGYVHIPRAIVKGTSAIAVPIIDVLGRPVAAVSTIAISSRQRADRVPDLVAQLTRAASEIGEAARRATSPEPPPTSGF